MNYFPHWPYVVCCAIMIVGSSPAWSEADRINSFKCFDRFDRQNNKGISDEEQVEACNRVLQDNPSDLQRYGAYLHRGLTYFELKNYKQAAADFDAFLPYAEHSNPSTLTITHERNAAANYLLKNYQKALSELDQAEAISKEAQQKDHRSGVSYDTPSWHYAMRGDVAFYSGKYAAAVDQYELYQQTAEGDLHSLGPDGIMRVQQNLKLARQMAANPKRSPSNPPGPAPSTEADACKLYPNLCP